MNCATCGHYQTDHPLRSCRAQGCPCLRFIVDHGNDLPLGPIGWSGCVMTGVLELVASRAEGVVHVATDDHRECVVKITFRALVPYTCSGGKA